MARKSYPWKYIKADFESGMSQAEIRKKYGVGAGALGNRIKRDGWRLSHEQSMNISEFKEASVKISESFHNANDIQKREMEDRIRTVLEDNELIQNNRKLLGAFQKKILNGIKDGAYERPQDIKQGTSAIRDIEFIANPRENKTEINNTNAQQTNISTNDISLAIAEGLPD